jgi:hypothetical protein
VSKLSVDLSSVTVVGLDLAKHIFQVYCMDSEERVVLSKSLRRVQVLGVFRQSAAVPRGAGGLRLGAPLGAGACAGT